MFKMISFLVLLFFSGFSEVLQYCGNSPAGFLGGYTNAHYGQVMTPSENKGMIQWVSVYTSRLCTGYVTGRLHRIELWHFNGIQPYSKFFDVEVFVPADVIGWFTTYTNQYWDGGSELHFVAVMQTEYTYFNPYAWSISQMGYDGLQHFSDIERNWQADQYGGNWSIFPGNLGYLMFKVGFLPGGSGVEPVSLGVIKTCFR